MRRGFVVGVLLFGLVAATAFAAYASTMDMAWPTVLKIWLMLFGALGLFPLWTGWTHGTPEGPAHHLLVRRDKPHPGEHTSPGAIRTRGPA